MDHIDFSWMIGRSVAVEFLDPAMWSFSIGGSGALRVECPWRLIEGGRIAVSDDDHRQQFGLPQPVDAAARANSLMGDTVITDVEVRQGTADLVLQLGDGLRLEILPFSSGYESWTVSGPEGIRVVAQGGGTLVTW